MTTSPVSSPHAGRLPALRRGCGSTTSAGAGAMAGLAAWFGVTTASLLYLVNSYGPLGEHRDAGTFVGLVAGVVAGSVVFTATWWVARRSRLLLAAALSVLAVGGWVLMPAQVDVSESWVPQVNARSTCAGWSFRHYPPGTSDANTVVYCVGLEHPIADG
jgi:hypothetical protein